MLQDSHTEDFVECSLAQRDLVNAGLKSRKFRCPGVISPSCVDRRAQIEGKDFCAGLQCELGEPPRAASSFENALPIKMRGPACRGIETISTQVVVHKFVDLNPIEMVPLKSERGCIILGRDETGNVTHDWNRCAATRTYKALLADLTGPGIFGSRGSDPQVAAALEAEKHLYSLLMHLSFLSFLAMEEPYEADSNSNPSSSNRRGRL
jgi:hypothetical protein